jgi:transcriptional regulator with XRE-family HTH domain
MRLRQEEIEYAIGRLEVLKNSRGLSQTDLGVFTGVEQSTISKILKRQQEPSIEILQRLFEGLGLQLADVLKAAADHLPKTLQGYLATPLTGLNERQDTSVRAVVDAVRRFSGAAEFSDPPIKIYWPGEYTHPKSNPAHTPNNVYLIDRSRASTFNFLVILCGAASYGVGQENEIATQAGVPAIRLVNSGVSRMMLGSFVKSVDIQYRGSLQEGIFFDGEEFAKALREIVRLHYHHGALYPVVNGNDFGPRLKKLVDERAFDNRAFAEGLGVSLDYVRAMMEEPISVSNPSARLLKRMSVLLGESVGFLLGEKEQDDEVYRESKESFFAWVGGSEEGVDARTALAVFDDWKTEYFARKVESSPASFRAEVRPMRKVDWDGKFQRAKAGGPAPGQQSMFGS